MRRELFQFFIIQMILLCNLNVYALNHPVHFHHYTLSDGISRGRVNCIIQDNDGYMWFGTNYGLNKFDGYEFTKYFSNKNDSTCLKGQKINALFVDSKKRLWIACSKDGGLFKYNPEEDNFKEYIHFTDKEMLNFSVYSITEDNRGNLWIGTTNGLCKIKTDEPGNETWYIQNIESSTFSYENYIYSVFFDSKKRLWIGERNGLFLFNQRKNNYIRYFPEKNDVNDTIISDVKAIVELDENILLAGTRGHGLITVILDKAKPEPDNTRILFNKNIPNTPNALGSNFINTIYKEENGTLWISTDHGLSCLLKQNIADQNSKPPFINYVYDPQNTESLNYDFVKCAYTDKSGVLWVGTNTGLNKSKNYKFKHIRQQHLNKGLKSNKIQAIYEANDGKIWLGTSKGLNLYDRKDDSFSSVLNGYEAILSICEQENNIFWIATWEDGIIKYNSKTKDYKQFTYEKGKLSSIGSPTTNLIFKDKDNTIWASAWGEGIYHYDNDKDEFIQKFNKNEISHVQVIYEDKDEQLWLGSLKGLFKILDKQLGTFKPFILLPDTLLKSGNIIVNCIIEDTKNQLWIGTDMGLFKKNDDDSFIHFSTEHGLPSLVISGIVPDETGKLWISTTNGLCNITLNNSIDTKNNISVKNFTLQHGLQGKEFVLNSFCKCKSSEILFGGTNGFNIFNPDFVKDNETPPFIKFSNFALFNKRIKPGEKIENRVILNQPLSLTKEITLLYDHNIFTIWFSALHYVAPEQNQYSYFMEGIDKEWNSIGNERKVTFIGLKPGDYVFKLKASNSDGVWNDTYKELIIKILPPWWQTLWFRILVIGFLIYTIYMMIKTRTRMLNKQKLLLEQTVEQRTSELKELNLVLEERQEEIETMAHKLHEADQKQLRFFTNISHEFRTPLTLIIGPLEKILRIKNLNKLSEWAGVNNHHQLMYRNAKRLQRLVNQIIDFRKLDLGNVKINESQNNIVDFIKDLVASFKTLAESKSIDLSFNIEHLTFNIDQDTIENDNFEMINDKCKMNNDKWSMINEFWFDPDVFEKILSNLISNAIKYTPEGGRILITIDVTVETLHAMSLQHQMVIKITDTGIGIAPEDQNKIFDRFYRSGSKGENEIEGTGIGLAYTKELLNLHNGEIKVESETGMGTTFILSFDIHSKQKSNIPEESIAKKQKPRFTLNEKVDLSIHEDFQYKTSGNEKKSDSVKYLGLIVEDNTDMRKYIANELKDTFRVMIAKDGIEGFETALQKNPDFIVSDIMMPRMDGIEMCRKIKGHENTSHIPVILLTALTGEENVIKALKTSADDYINKPFNTRILKAKIENLLLIRKQLREKFNQSVSVNPKDVSPSPVDEFFLQRAIEIVEQNISNTELTNEKFVSLLKYSRSMVYSKLKSLTGLSVREFIQNIIDSESLQQ